MADPGDNQQMRFPHLEEDDPLETLVTKVQKLRPFMMKAADFIMKNLFYVVLLLFASMYILECLGCFESRKQTRNGDKSKVN